MNTRACEAIFSRVVIATHKGKTALCVMCITISTENQLTARNIDTLIRNIDMS